MRTFAGRNGCAEPFPVSHFRSYFDALHFRFEPRFREGLRRYLTEAVAVGELSEVPEISIFEVV